ncbi:hypothetical protein [Pseudomonas rhodesiae]|uniref:hypothetical protein n=1 Tax=Pseudomonas rhodesiae TaxID=76760 RepID=UPI0032B1CFCF
MALTLDGYSANEDGIVEIKLSTVSGSLKLSIPDERIKSPYDLLYPTLGEDGLDTAEWQGNQVQTGEDDEEGDTVKRKGIKLDIPRSALMTYVGKTVDLFFVTSGESGKTTSEPLRIKVQE